MVLPTGRMWLGTVVLSGLMLSFSIPLTSSQNQAIENQVPIFKQIQIASNKFPNETYTQVIHQKLYWTTLNESFAPATVNDGNGSVTVLADVKPEAKPETKLDVKPTAKAVQTASVSSTAVSRGSADNSVLINHALSLQGIRYVFGGTSRNGFDCSGFTQYVFAGSEISLPRTSFEQFKTGTSVNREQLQQGDLVFFTTYAKGASHVGIYIGGGNFVHASINGVKISSLIEGYYNSHYVGARRVL